MNRTDLIRKWRIVLPKELLVDLESVIHHHVEIGVQAKTRMRKAVESAKPPKRFDRERFEAMFRAVIMGSGNSFTGDEFTLTEYIITKLDAYYAEKEKGGANV